MKLPAFLMPHTVVVEALAGEGAYGDTYADPVEVPCWRDEKRRLVRNADGDEVVSESALATDVDWAERFPENSRVTIPETGRQTVVLSTRVATDGGMGAWQHCEVVLA